MKNSILKILLFCTFAISMPCYAAEAYKGFLYQISRPNKEGNELHYVWGISHFIKNQEYVLTKKLDEAYLDSSIYMSEFNFYSAENQSRDSDHYQSSEILLNQADQVAQDMLVKFLKNNQISSAVIEKTTKLISFSLYVELQRRMSYRFDWPQFAPGFDTRKIQQTHTGLLRVDFLETKSELMSAWEKSCASPEDRRSLVMGLASDDFYEAMFVSTPKTFEYVAKGDIENFTKIEQELIEKYAAHRSLYQCLVWPRNITWADKIDRLENKDDTIFMAVGAAHLFGKNNFLDQLKSRGYKVEFIEQ
jgi:uncharacterized protein YbaP (TraB family)